MSVHPYTLYYMEHEKVLQKYEFLIGYGIHTTPGALLFQRPGFTAAGQAQRAPAVLFFSQDILDYSFFGIRNPVAFQAGRYIHGFDDCGKFPGENRILSPGREGTAV